MPCIPYRSTVIPYTARSCWLHEIPKLEHHPLSAVRDCSFSIFIPVPRNWTSPLFATRGRSVTQWQALNMTVRQSQVHDGRTSAVRICFISLSANGLVFGLQTVICHLERWSLTVCVITVSNFVQFQEQTYVINDGLVGAFVLLRNSEGITSHSRLGGVVVSVLATGPKACGFEPSQGEEFLRCDKNPQHTFLSDGK
jgi:hypothetical protein